MFLPIYVYGQPVLRKKAVDISPDYENLQSFIQDMFETMDKADGIGLAAPQVGKSVRLFVIDSTPLVKDDNNVVPFRKVFINARITERSGEPLVYNEGCLSLPNIHEDVERPSVVTIEYVDENFVPFRETYDGVVARIIQHEYDHIEGVLFIDHISALRRKMLSGKLTAIAKGKMEVRYRIRIAK
ncbi:MAG: peptide deformylase [Bacteroidales bacterium]